MAQSTTDDNSATSGTVRWNNRDQARHWNITFNNYTEEDEDQIKKALRNNSSKIVSAIMAREVGDSGTPHIQGYIHFQRRARQSTVHSFLGYKKPTFHLSVLRKTPLAAFRYCMKDGDYYVVGKDLDKVARLKDKVQAETGKRSDQYSNITEAIEKREITTMAEIRAIDAELAAERADYWRDQIVSAMGKPRVEIHPLRPWQAALVERLKEPPNDREVIFVIDTAGDAGKTYFTDLYEQEHGKSYTVGADKRDDISLILMNNIIEFGKPDVVFMDAPRARSNYISSPFLEELKNGQVRSNKYRSKSIYLDKRPHVVVMTNAWPKKTPNDEGLSNDRYTYLLIKPENKFEWLHGYRSDEGGAFSPHFNRPD